jgi:2,5-diamino-6-(ribosylamino)-4(3H)-pyrimidinone 5'-phosphate reductase
MLPRVILHNAVSADGRFDWFTPDIGLYYELASRWQVDAHLAGSNTMLAAQDEDIPEDESAPAPPEDNSDDTRPLLVVPDSRGRIRNWHILRRAPYWRKMLALCSHTTPQTYLDYLKEENIDCIVVGDDHVDLKLAMEELNTRYGVESVHVDSGGTLNGTLLRAGLVSEVSILISPCLVGGTTPNSIFKASDLTSSEGVINLRLVHFEKLRNDVIWLRYEISG